MPVVMMSGHGTIDTAVEATRIGAYDFLEKPIALQKLLATVGRALRSGEQQVKPTLMLATLGRAPVVAELKQRLERVTNLKSPLLLVAEPGSSVELCARFVHQPNATWLAPENLAVLAEAPLDLLGQAREGTLFLHEVGELSRMEQKGLLLIVGKLDKYNTRLICATARALPELVAQGGFDARLYAAIATVTVHIPSLREHREDIPDLANLFLLRSIEAKEVTSRHFNTAALNALRNYDWPGNLNQLESTVRSLAITASGEEISVGDVNQALSLFGTQQATAPGLPLDLT
jgi:two-component system, NtrC family, nitrogen regulation response regulator NtrX